MDPVLNLKPEQVEELRVWLIATRAPQDQWSKQRKPSSGDGSVADDPGPRPKTDKQVALYHDASNDTSVQLGHRHHTSCENERVTNVVSSLSSRVPDSMLSEAAANEAGLSNIPSSRGVQRGEGNTDTSLSKAKVEGSSRSNIRNGNHRDAVAEDSYVTVMGFVISFPSLRLTDDVDKPLVDMDPFGLLKTDSGLELPAADKMANPDLQIIGPYEHAEPGPTAARDASSQPTHLVKAMSQSQAHAQQWLPEDREQTHTIAYEGTNVA